MDVKKGILVIVYLWLGVFLTSAVICYFVLGFDKPQMVNLIVSWSISGLIIGVILALDKIFSLEEKIVNFERKLTVTEEKFATRFKLAEKRFIKRFKR